TVTPNPKILAIDSTQQFTVEGRDAFGNTVSITPTWSVVASGGTIDNAGLFKAGTVAGTFPNTVRACSTALCAIGSVFGFATVTVSSGVLATITVSPNPAAVGTDASQPFTAVGRDADGNIIAISPAPTWSVLTTFAGVGAVTPAGGTILSPSGVYTAPTLAGSGIDSVQACSANPCVSGSVFGFAEVNVSASGALVSIAVTPNPASVGASGPVQFTATGFDATGLIVPTPGLAWSVVPSQSAAGTIDGLTGLLTAGAVVGTYTNAVKALSGTISGFATVTVTAASLIDFGAAAPNGIMAGTAVTCINNGLIQADVSVSPGNTITGFGPCVITGVLHLADAVALAGQNDLTTAYNTLQALPCPPANAIVADLGGTTKAAGVYCTASSIGVTGVVTLDGGGDPNANFVFQAGTSIITAGDVVLINGAQAKNVYWVSGSSVTLGTASQFKGNVVALTSITLVDTANLIGRALARNGAVSLGTGNTITLP
ncbi:MAG: ice-binding family protein, partial [Gemmatimonadales bacterium]|nr:ice-binding family protein [Gemmatimonadales bacterium]